jgi:signal transduction histidine kinase/HAMP domain-containing protein
MAFATLLPRAWEKLTLSARLMISSGLALALVSAWLVYTIVASDIERGRRQLADKLHDEIEFIVPAIAEQAVIGDYSLIEQMLKARVEHPLIARAGWIDTLGNQVIARGAGTARRAPAWFIDWAALPSKEVSRAIEVGGDSYGRVFLQIDPASTLNDSWDRSVELLELVLLGIGLLFTIILVVTRSSLRPLVNLAQGAARFGKGDYSARIGDDGPPEVRASIAAFNGMAARLQESYVDLEKKVGVRTRELAQSVAELRALGEVSQAVNSTLDLETVLTTIVAKAVELSGTDAGEISEFDEQRREFLLRATYGMSEAMIAVLKDHHLGTGEFVRQAAAQREPIQIADMRKRPASAARDIVLAAGHRGLLIVPLLRPDRVAAALVVRRRKPGAFAERTIHVLQTFATQSVLAIRNAHLFAEIEEKRRQLEVAGQQKSQFFAAASHDLRQPMHALSLYSDTLKLQAPSGAIGEIAGHIDKAVASLSALVDSLLDISRLDAGVVLPEVQPVSVRTLLESIEVGYRPVAREKGLEFRIEAADGLVSTDPVLLERLVRNLVDNAFKYTAAGGVTLRAELAGPTVRIAVCDSGPGIPAAERERIFEEFYQIGNPERDRSQGLGLGLAIVRRLAQLLGLQITLESEPGRGSTFSVTMPLAEEKSASRRAPAAAPGARSLAGTQVLVIDDEPEVRTGMQMVLEQVGCRVATCGGYAEAERLLDRQPLDVQLIIADFRLRQNESGIETVRRLRARLGNVPALLLSGDTAPERLREAKSSGLRLVHKPLSADKLTKSMLAALQD